MDRSFFIREEQTGSLQKSTVGESVRLENVLGHPPRSDTAIAYIAGIIDGEGCIQIQKPKCYNREKSQPYKLQLRVSNTDVRLIEYINSIFPAYIYNGSEKRIGRRNQFCWHANSKKATEILELTLPFLIIKRDQAELAIKFQETFNKYYGIHGLPKTVLDFRESCYQECRQMKKIAFKPIPKGYS